MSEPEGARNETFDWDTFDSKAYADDNHYLWEAKPDARRPLECDVWVFGRLLWGLGSVRRAQPGPLQIVDIGTGSNLSSVIAELPFGRVRVIEHSAANRRHITECQRDGLEGAGYYGWIAEAARRQVIIPPELFGQVEVTGGDVFDLPKGIADVIVMLSCVESATGDPAQLDRGFESIIGALRQGGSMLAFFMGNPEGGYDVASKRWPAVDVDGDFLLKRFRPRFEHVHVREVPGAGEIREGCTMWHVEARGRLDG